MGATNYPQPLTGGVGSDMRRLASAAGIDLISGVAPTPKQPGERAVRERLENLNQRLQKIASRLCAARCNYFGTVPSGPSGDEAANGPNCVMDEVTMCLNACHLLMNGIEEEVGHIESGLSRI